MIKPPKQKEETCEPAPLSDSELKSMTDFHSFYQYRDLAQIMIDHDFLPPIPTGKEYDKQWQIDELALRLSYCAAAEISEIFANKLNKIQNSYSIPADVHSRYFSKKHRSAEFETLESTNELCRIRCHLKPSLPWITVTFDIVDAQDQKLIKEKSVHWKGNGIQNMLAKNCRAKAETILDRSFIGNASVEYSEEEPKSMQKIEEDSKTQIISFSKDESPKTFTPPISIEAEPVQEEPIAEVFEILESSSEANLAPFTPEEIKEIRDQKISELPPSPDAPPEIMETLDIIDETVAPVNEITPIIIKEEIKEEKSSRKEKKAKKGDKPDLSFLDKKSLKETEIKELRKPFGMSQLTIKDPKYHTEFYYKRIGDDWFRSFTIKESRELIGIDMNIVAFTNVLQSYNSDILPKIQTQYENLIHESNETEKLVVLFHDAMTMIENPPDLAIIDNKYFEMMNNMVSAMEKVAEVIKTTKPEDVLGFIVGASKGKWTNKEALWGYKYMEARGLI
jgi:hypothetical protein